MRSTRIAAAACRGRRPRRSPAGPAQAPALAPDLMWRGLPAALRAGGRVDRVELKVVLDASLEDAMALLGAEVAPPVLRTVHYLDTPDLALLRRGIVARARATRGVGARGAGEDGRREDVVVKLRRRTPYTGRRFVELDALPASVRWSATSRRDCEPGEVAGALARDSPARYLLDDAQRALVVCAAGGAIADLDELAVLGPVEVLRLKSAGRGECVVVESWTCPGGERIVELSVKCHPRRSRRTAAALRELVTTRGVALSQLQLTKTRTSLQHLTGTGGPTAADDARV